jgi:LacI family transcriptional regulator
METVFKRGSRPQDTVTINDVARAAGVSPATVSRVLNDTMRVREDKYRQVMAAVAELDYRPNRFASILRGGATRTIGVMVPSLEKDFSGRVVGGIERVLKRAGLHMLCALGHDTEAGEEEVLEMFGERVVDGFILLADRLADTRLLDLARRGKPFVLINRYLPEIGGQCVRLDNLGGGYTATRHLIERGHARIAHIAGPMSRPGARLRFQGYADALAAAQLARDEALIVEAEFTAAAGAEAMRRLLRDRSFTAVFASDDNQALGAMQALREAGRRVPDDVAIVGFDDASFAAYLDPPLTTMRYPMGLLGEAAAEQLLALMAEQPTRLRVLEPELVVRASTAAGA